MKILLILAAMYLICALSGRLIAILISGRGRRLPISAHVGYAYTLIAFYGLYLATKSARAATWITLALPVIGNIVLLAIRQGRRGHSLPVAPTEPKESPRHRNKDSLYPLLACVLVVGFAAWPYLFSGWGNYWHSGNEDVEDGLNGRDAYLDGSVFGSNQKAVNSGISATAGTPASKGDPSRGDLLRAMNALRRRLPRDMSATESFGSGVIPLQYSSLAFWSVALQARHGLDIFLEQALIDLLLMLTGIYYLSRHAFGMSSLAAGFAGSVSVLATFYLGTYYAGHEGSMMYGALIPALLYLLLARAKPQPSRMQILAYGGIILGAIGLSYPFPLPLVIPAASAYRLWTTRSVRAVIAKFWWALKPHRIALMLVTLAVAILLALSLWELWNATAGFRFTESHEYRPWGYTHDWLIIPLYLGLVPPPVAGSHFLVALIGLRGYWILVAGAAILSLLLIPMFWKFRPIINSGFMALFGVSSVPLYFLFRFVISDSYYIYKFLYTHQFLVVIAIVGFCSTTRHSAARGICGLLLTANLLMDIVMAQQIYSRPYNHNPGRLAALSKIDRNILEHSFVAVTGGEATAVRQTLLTIGTQHELDFRAAEYFIVPAHGEADIVDHQFPAVIRKVGEQLSIKPAQPMNGLMARTTRSEPEVDPKDPVLRSALFRWMGGRQDTDILGIYIIRPSTPVLPSPKYLRICAQAGPSATGDIPLSVTTATGVILAKTVLSGIQCIWIPSGQLAGVAQPLLVQSNAAGKSLLPFDDRILLYRVFGIGWSDETYDDRALSFLNLSRDIIHHGHSHSTVQVQLGAGWGDYEVYQGERFRWAGILSDLVLTNSSGSSTDTTLEVTLEPGPSHGKNPLLFSVHDSAGKEVFRSHPVSHRETLTFQLKCTAGVKSIYHFQSNAEHLHLAADPRILDYRIFNITAQ